MIYEKWLLSHNILFTQPHIQDLIYRIKTAFNTEFEALHKQKVQELNRVKDRNRHIRELMLKLDMKEELWEPSLTNSEWPERLFTVDDSEVLELNLLKHLNIWRSSQSLMHKTKMSQ